MRRRDDYELELDYSPGLDDNIGFYADDQTIEEEFKHLTEYTADWTRDHKENWE